jgi:hypothetical protein
LTPAQYGCIVLFLFGLFMIPYVRGLSLRGVDAAEAVRASPAPKSNDAQAVA